MTNLKEQWEAMYDYAADSYGGDYNDGIIKEELSVLIKK